MTIAVLGSSKYSNPVPGGTVGRTDQGVDISASPGTPVDAITNETLVGIVRNWYKGQPFYWFKQAGGGYNYVAEQFKSGLRIGQSVRQGQPIGTVAASGTGLEFGWATKSGQTLAKATTGYTEGQVTPAGRSYRSQVLGSGSGGSGSSTSLEQLWIDAGGPPGVAQTMAAIALAESGGDLSTPPNKNPDGSTDFGLWRINSSHTQFNTTRLQSDPFYNAQAAVAIYKSQGLQAWTAYNTGAFRSFLGRATSATINYGGPNGGIVRPGGGSSSSQVPQALQDYVNLRDTPRTAAPTTRNPALWWWASFTGNWQRVGSV